MALRPLQRLDRRLLVDRQHDRVVRRIQMEPDDVGRLGGELGVGRDAPGLAPGQVDPLAAQKAPHVLVADVAQLLGQQGGCPAGEAIASGLGEPRPGSRPPPYNLLVTRSWMLLVPRSRDSALGVSVNALGFAGALLVRDHAQMVAVVDLGPMTVLRRVAFAVDP
jgi:hypothetical protein